MKNKNHIEQIHKAIDRIRTRGTPHGVKDAFEMCKLIAEETKPHCVKAEKEFALLVAVAEAADAFDAGTDSLMLWADMRDALNEWRRFKEAKK